MKVDLDEIRAWILDTYTPVDGLTERELLVFRVIESKRRNKDFRAEMWARQCGMSERQVKMLTNPKAVIHKGFFFPNGVTLSE